MKDSEVYLRAAERVAKDNFYSCRAIDDAAGGQYTKQRYKYVDLFASELYGDYPVLLVSAVEATCRPKQWRVLALCFMAAIAKSEGR